MPSPFAGFELRQAYEKPELREHEGWARFIGASYFRGVGEANQFGLSARGIAENTGIQNPEEFPDFTHFWIDEGEDTNDAVDVYALLDGPSVSPAPITSSCIAAAATTMDITCELHLRKPIERLGIAPLTSMFWYSETVKGTATDWRPEIHDSDGLAIWNGKGEHIWRPLNDPNTLNISAFEDENPRGFGLMQRDKNYDHYLDAVFYEKRPCGWIEPRGDWGKGSVQLVEIPTDNEIYDNIIAMWVPAAPNQAGQVLTFAYRPVVARHRSVPWRSGALRRDPPRRRRDPRARHARRCSANSWSSSRATTSTSSTKARSRKRSSPPRAGYSSTSTPNHRPTAPATCGARSSISIRKGPIPSRCAASCATVAKPLTETWAYRYIPFVSPVR